MMKRLALLIAWILILAGGLAIAAGAVYSFWNIWKNPMWLLSPLAPIIVLGGTFLFAIGIAIFSSLRYPNR